MYSLLAVDELLHVNKKLFPFRIIKPASAEEIADAGENQEVDYNKEGLEDGVHALLLFEDLVALLRIHLSDVFGPVLGNPLIIFVGFIFHGI